MPHIALPPDLPGIRGAMAFRPETARPLNALVEVLLHRPQHPHPRRTRTDRHLRVEPQLHPLLPQHPRRHCRRAPGRRRSPRQAGQDRLHPGRHLPKLKALLVIAGKVQQDGKLVTAADVEAARREGATDLEIHDTVLIAAAFCMYNRYVDGLGTVPARRRSALSRTRHARGPRRLRHRERRIPGRPRHSGSHQLNQLITDHCALNH